MGALLLAAALAAAASDEIVVGGLAHPDTLLPHSATDTLTATVAANACEPLVRVRQAGEPPAPLLATSWASADRRRWILTLRPGVRFHDGTAFDADAVVANLDDLRGHGRFEGAAHRVGPLVVAIQLEAPNAALLATLSQPFHGMQSPRRLGKAVGPVPVCTGPYRVASLRKGEIRLERFDGYWGAAPATRVVVFRELRDEAALERALEAGTIDVAASLSPRAAAALRGDARLTVRTWTGLNLAYLTLNNTKAPFHDRRVRQAIARSVDREGLVRDLLGGQGVTARNPLPPGVAGFAARTPELTYEPRLARRLLAEAGYGRGLDVELLTTREARPTISDPVAVAQHVQHDLAAAGVRVSLRIVPTWSEYVRQVTSGAYEMALLGWEADTLDANDFLGALVSRAAIGRTNRSRYASDAMENLLREGRRGVDERERHRTYAGVQRLFQREMPWVPLFHASRFLAHRTAVQGLETDPTGILRYARARRQP